LPPIRQTADRSPGRRQRGSQRSDLRPAASLAVFARRGAPWLCAPWLCPPWLFPP